LKCSDCGSWSVVIKSFATPARPAQNADEMQGLDLSNVADAKLASMRQLRSIREDDRAILSTVMTETDRKEFGPTRLAILNPLNQVVPFEGDDEAEPGLPEMQYFMHEGVRRLKIKPSANDRYYIVMRGLEFTGVVRGAHLYNIYAAPGISNSGGQGIDTRAEAELAWFTAFYAGRCAKVFPETAVPAVPFFA
jgi:hypothetical protein